MKPKPMDAGEAITMAIFELEHAITPHYEADDSRRAIESLQSLRARLRREREAIEKVRDEMDAHLFPRTAHDDLDFFAEPLPKDFMRWLAALDAILRGEGTT